MLKKMKQKINDFEDAVNKKVSDLENEYKEYKDKKKQETKKQLYLH